MWRVAGVVDRSMCIRTPLRGRCGSGAIRTTRPLEAQKTLRQGGNVPTMRPARRGKVRLDGVETGSDSYRKERLDRNASGKGATARGRRGGRRETRRRKQQKIGWVCATKQAAPRLAVHKEVREGQKAWRRRRDDGQQARHDR